MIHMNMVAHRSKCGSRTECMHHPKS
uniref:Uncharacterized protein n=1 Tax=Arundo donax TaxID=35708 RepID=A0A0A9AE17_ARUDO